LLFSFAPDLELLSEMVLVLVLAQDSNAPVHHQQQQQQQNGETNSQLKPESNRIKLFFCVLSALNTQLKPESKTLKMLCLGYSADKF
jgi:hypothetical protein